MRAECLAWCKCNEVLYNTRTGGREESLHRTIQQFSSCSRDVLFSLATLAREHLHELSMWKMI